jgi:hypothetical protein
VLPTERFDVGRELRKCDWHGRRVPRTVGVARCRRLGDVALDARVRVEFSGRRRAGSLFPCSPGSEACAPVP